MNFFATKARVYNRGCPPDGFLTELVNWGKTAPEEIFAVNSEPQDVYDHIRPFLGPWESILHRRAAMLEVLRVLAGFESSWNWNEGVDTTNASSNRPETEEAGEWQVSENSEFFGHDLKALVAAKVGDRDGDGDVDGCDFQIAMKLDHPLAMEYIARLLRHTIRHNGPLLRNGTNSVYPWLSRDSVKEFEQLLLT